MDHLKKDLKGICPSGRRVPYRPGNLSTLNPQPIFHHIHPYEPFNLEHATRLIVGTLPPPRFTVGTFKLGDVDFCYGSISGLLWPILDSLFDLGLVYNNTAFAKAQREKFLLERNIGICDMVASAKRNKIDASDLGMLDVQLRDLIGYLKKYKQIDTLLFTGGNSKNGPEYHFRRHANEYGIKLKNISNEVPRIHSFELGEGEEKRILKTVSLTAPSGAANRAVGSNKLYQKLKDENPAFTTLEFRKMQYRPFFE